MRLVSQITQPLGIVVFHGCEIVGIPIAKDSNASDILKQKLARILGLAQ